MREADNSGFGHRRVLHQRALDFSGAQSVARNVDDIVDATGDPNVPILRWVCLPQLHGSWDVLKPRRVLRRPR